MITASTDTVQPAIDIASLALCKSDNPEESVQSPQADAIAGTDLGTIDGAAVYGPMLPSAAEPFTPADVPAGSLISVDATNSTDSVMKDGDIEPATPADSVMDDDASTRDYGPTKQSKLDDGSMPAPPTRPPPVPPRADPKPVIKPVVPSSTKIGRIEESARQQDAAEVMANIFDLIRCAITGDSILREGEQGDAIKDLFFGEVTTVMEKPGGTEKAHEFRDHFLVATGRRDRSLYATLDEDFGLSEIEGGGGSRYDYVERPAPIQIINVKRLQFEKGEAIYDRSHVGLEKVVYLDRYLAQTPTLSEAQLLELRKTQWAKQKQLRELEAKKTKLQKTGLGNMNLPDCLEASSDYINNLIIEKLGKQDYEAASTSLPTPPPELSDTLQNSARDLATELSGIDAQISSLESEIDNVFRGCNSVPYRLHAIFTHRGDVKGGHYWIYIYDFQSNEWRSYNDESVEKVVDESEVLNKEDKIRPKVSAGVVYVRADLAEEYTEAVYRKPERSDQEARPDVEMKDFVADSDDEMPALEPIDMKNVPVIEGVEKE